MTLRYYVDGVDFIVVDTEDYKIMYKILNNLVVNKWGYNDLKNYTYEKRNVLATSFEDLLPERLAKNNYIFDPYTLDVDEYTLERILKCILEYAGDIKKYNSKETLKLHGNALNKFYKQVVKSKLDDVECLVCENTYNHIYEEPDTTLVIQEYGEDLYKDWTELIIDEEIISIKDTKKCRYILRKIPTKGTYITIGRSEEIKIYKVGDFIRDIDYALEYLGNRNGDSGRVKRYTLSAEELEKILKK